ncbi:MAG: Peptidoglycan/LPS O-acetylase OafA/YrhL, contains acyltransferase and SGNH-hydrolase domain [Blastococcus sp.]|nr:Peptidoglycan/LPS O-acetylase OafA/YrhL, contains acyltransferase and SGNH-hydrolase domain [Blastococcus sp.]
MDSSSGVLTHGDYAGTRRFAVLDGLRAIAILLVFTAHPRGDIWPFLHGASGVTLFFVLSGFLITTLLLREEDRRGRVDLRSFFIRRTFRIYPLFLAIFALYCVLILVLGMQPERRDSFVESIPFILLLFPEHMMFFVEDGAHPPFNGAWSIGIEEKFYLVWPLLGFVALARWKHARLPLLIALCLGSAIAGHIDGALFLAPYQHLGYGAIVAVLLHRPATYTWMARLGRRPVLLAIVAVATTLQLATDAILLEGPLYGVHGVLLAALLAGLVTTRSRGVSWLSSRPMVFLAAISYAFYLTHNFALNGVEAVVPADWGLLGWLLSASVALVVSIAVSWVIHTTFEEPARKYGVRLSERRRRLDATVARPAELQPTAR